MEENMEINYYNDFILKTSNDLQSDNEIVITQKIIKNINHIFSLSLTELSTQSYSSPATIIRFIKRLGFESYTDFRQKVSSSYIQSIPNEVANRGKSKRSLNILKVKKFYEEKVHCLESTYNHLNISALKDLANQLVQARSVTLLGDYHSLEIFYLLSITLNMYNIPCYIFKQKEVLLEHLHTRKEGDLVLHTLSNMANQHPYIFNNKVAKNVLIKVSNKFFDYEHYYDKVYKVVDNEEDEYLSLQLIGNIIVYFISAEILGESNGQTKV